jgi:hypothetical protein
MKGLGLRLVADTGRGRLTEYREGCVLKRRPYMSLRAVDQQVPAPSLSR